jgi:23S rRNA-/tRNA-specific pseudouridylate synthase
VVWEDAYYFFVDKPAGFAVAGEAKGVNSFGKAKGVQSFHDVVKAYAAQRYAPIPSLQGSVRLDKGTSGLMIYAKTLAAAKHYLKLQDQDGAIAQDYLAVVAGALPSQQGEITGNIMRSKGKVTFSVVKYETPGSKPVRTFYRRLQSMAPEPTAAAAVSEWFEAAAAPSTRAAKANKAKPAQEVLFGVALRLGTGRKHQLRASLRSVGCSVVGDKRYGGPKFKANQHGIDSSGGVSGGLRAGAILLHAHRVSFKGPVLAKGVPAVRYDVACAPPAAWGKLVELVAGEAGELDEWWRALDEEDATDAQPAKSKTA